MRIRLILALCLLLSSGCSVIPDALFSVFGGNYTGGGTTRAQKREHYDRQVEASRGYDLEYSTSY
jgi:hypothetical protein